jgi:DNA-binding XRE family transcriptional regulator
MPNLMPILRSEISRLARKEAKAAASPLRKPSVAARKAFAGLKRRVASLERETKRLAALVAKIPVPQPEPSAGARNWISGKGVKSLRRRLGLSQEAFAKLVGVTSNAVYVWESKPGMLRMREATTAAVMSVRGLGAREAKKRVEEMGKAEKTGAKARKQGGKRSR